MCEESMFFRSVSAGCIGAAFPVPGAGALLGIHTPVYSSSLDPRIACAESCSDLWESSSVSQSVVHLEGFHRRFACCSMRVRRLLMGALLGRLVWRTPRQCRVAATACRGDSPHLMRCSIEDRLRGSQCSLERWRCEPVAEQQVSWGPLIGTT